MAFEPQIPMLALLAATAAGFVVGGLWYSPLLFGHVWARLMGMSMDERPGTKVMLRAYAITVVGLVLMFYVFAHVMEAFFQAGEDRIYANAALGGVWVWLGFVVPVHAGRVAWSRSGWRLFAIDAAHHLVLLQVAAAIFFFWPGSS